MESRRSPSTTVLTLVADGQRLLEQGLVRADALDGQNAALNFGDGGVAVGGGEPAGIADLSAGVAVEAGLIEDDIDLIACSGGGNAYAVLDDGEDFGVVCGELLVAEEVGLGQFAKGGAGGFLAAAFPTGAGAGLFFGAGGFEAFVIEADAGVARSIDHKVERQTEGFVEVEGIGRLEDRVAGSTASLRRLLGHAASAARLLAEFDAYRDCPFSCSFFCVVLTTCRKIDH